MKKIAVITALCATLLFATSVTAFAHGHYRGGGYGYGGGVARQQSYSLCDADLCNTAGLHNHGGMYYSGHYIGDGHDYHQLCDVQGCTYTGVHEHDGVACFGHYAGDGHGYHNYGYNNGHWYR